MSLETLKVENSNLIYAFFFADNSLQANKAFLTKDLCGQSYLCYLIKNKNLLNFVKIKKNRNDSCIIFTEKAFISAKDACELTVTKSILFSK